MRLVFTLICVCFLMSAFSQSGNNYSQDELIIKFKSIDSIDFKQIMLKQRFNHKSLDSLNKLFFVIRIKRIGNRRRSDSYILKFKSKQNIDTLVQKYLDTGLFEYVEPNFIGKGSGQEATTQIIPNDTDFSKQWGLYNDGSFSLSDAITDADIDMSLAWEIEQGSPSIVVAVLDGGAKLDHSEFNGRIWKNPYESKNDNDDDDNGYIDDINGWDFAYDNNDPTDDGGHGTNVAGIIGANGNNNSGYAGVDWNCQLMICKIIDDSNSGYYSWWADAIYYAVDNGANAINMSVGGLDFSNLLKDAINYAYNNKVTIIACMMNENNSIAYYPAAYQNTIAVGSTDPDDQRSSPFFWSETSGSNYGDHIDVVAPGNFIYGLSHKSNYTYSSYWGGTSQATPLVTGLTSLLLAQDSNRTPDDIRSIITNTSEDQIGNLKEDVAGFDIYYGHGRINAYQALLQHSTNIDLTEIKEIGILVYTNPSSDYIIIDNNSIAAEITITSAEGSEVYNNKSLDKTALLKINISQFPTGIYNVKLTDKNGNTIASENVEFNE